MPGPKMGPRPPDFDEQVIRQSPTFVRWSNLPNGEKLKYACREFVKGRGDDEERLMRRIMIARRNNLRDHRTLKKARARLAVAASAPKAVAAVPVTPSASAAKNVPATASATHTDEAAAGRTAVRRRRPASLFSDAQIAKEMDTDAVIATRSYKTWLNLPNGEAFIYNQKYIKGHEGHDWLLRKNIWRRMRYRRENRKMVKKLMEDEVDHVVTARKAVGMSPASHSNAQAQPQAQDQLQAPPEHSQVQTQVRTQGQVPTQSQPQIPQQPARQPRQQPQAQEERQDPPTQLRTVQHGSQQQPLSQSHPSQATAPAPNPVPEATSVQLSDRLHPADAGQNHRHALLSTDGTLSAPSTDGVPDRTMLHGHHENDPVSAAADAVEQCSRSHDFQVETAAVEAAVAVAESYAKSVVAPTDVMDSLVHDSLEVGTAAALDAAARLAAGMHVLQELPHHEAGESHATSV